MRYAIQKCAGEHVPGPGEVLWLARERRYESFKPIVSNVGAIGPVGYHQRRYSSSQFLERLTRVPGIAKGASFGFIAEKQICLVQRLVESITENLWDEGLRACNGDFRLVPSGNRNSFANRSLAGFGVREDISFDEYPLRIFNPLSIDMPVRQMACNRQTSTHGPFGVRSDNADASSGYLVNNDGISNIDTQLFELACIKKTIAIVANAADESGLASKLREGDDGVRDRPTADKLRLVAVVALKQLILFLDFNKTHCAALETK